MQAYDGGIWLHVRSRRYEPPDRAVNIEIHVICYIVRRLFAMPKQVQ